MLLLGGIHYDGMKQRPQHMADFLVTAGYQVFYASLPEEKIQLSENEFESLTLENIILKYSTRKSENLFVLKRIHKLSNAETGMAELFKKLEELVGEQNLIIIATHPIFMKYLALISDKVKIIYDCLDDWESFYYDLGWGYSRSLIYYERKLASISDVVLASSKKLYTKMALYNDNLYYLPNGVNNKDYQKSKLTFDPIELKSINKPIIFFMGAIASWVDINLIKFISDKRPHYSFVFVGSMIKESLPESDNVYFLGEKRYEELSNYLRHAKVAIVPFKTSNLTAAVTPLKFYEYLSAGIPTVTTMLPDLLGLEGATIAQDYNEFLNAIDEYVNMETIEYNHIQNSAKQTVSMFDWKKLFNSIHGIIENNALFENKEVVIQSTINVYKNYLSNNLVRNELLNMYNTLNEFDKIYKLFPWNVIKQYNTQFDYNQLALTYLRMGEFDRAVQLLFLYIENNEHFLLYRQYIIELLKMDNKDLLIEGIILKLCGRHFEALKLLDGYFHEPKIIGMIIGLYFELFEREIALDLLSNIPSGIKLIDILDPYSYQEVIDYFTDIQDYDTAEYLSLKMFKEGFEKESTEKLGYIYFMKNLPN